MEKRPLDDYTEHMNILACAPELDWVEGLRVHFFVQYGFRRVDEDVCSECVGGEGGVAARFNHVVLAGGRKALCRR
ncbi:hypothetical protein Spb1_02170 [Planctopirus ephydatiae]|uniref:Uncharacterized protein n=1 Tax=Planctopirus ephydatiae TaxID=2528019 RepID=A0A518GID7_9PLAN|nr:hypothetical protein Spb1_02170 [Planctopirus ephydatiae]